MDREELLGQLRALLVEWLYMRAAQQYGRRIIYRPPGEWEGFGLAFKPDGTGFAENDGKPATFIWRDGAISYNELRAMSEEELQVVAGRIFPEQVAAKLSDPYIVDMSRFKEQIEFKAGSREELEQVTKWIAQANPDIFQGGDDISLTYTADTDTAPGGLQMRLMALTEREASLFKLAFEHNRFTGAYWDYEDRGRRRFSDFRKRTGRVIITVQPPSAHERAEAILGLMDWLVGKVPADELRGLLGTW